MTSGAAVHAKGLQRSSLSDVVIDGQEYSRHDSVEIAEEVRNELMNADLQREGQERGLESVNDKSVE